MKNIPPITVVDVFNTDYGAYRILRTRVKKIDSDDRFENYLVCPEGEWAEKMKGEGIRVVTLRMNRRIDPLTSIIDTRSLRNVFRDLDPDIIHTHNSKPGVIGRLASRKSSGRVMVHQVHGFHFSHKNGIKRLLYESIEKTMARHFTDVLLFQNKDEFNYSLNNGFGKRSKLEYIGNGIPMEEFSGYRNKKKNINNQLPTIVCVARYEPVKNHRQLFEAVKILTERGHNLRVKLIGEGFTENELRRESKELGIDRAVTFVGTLDRQEVIKEIFESDIAVLTSIKEGKPRFLMEASTLGTPIVATDVVGTREVVINGTNGFLVPLNDSLSLAERVESLLTNNMLHSQLVDSGRKYALENFDENIVIDQIKEVYIREVNECPKKSQ